jgi:hypothetical protein
MSPHSIAALNLLPDREKETIYSRFIPKELLERFNIQTDFQDALGNRLLTLHCNQGSTDVTLDLRHTADAQDPLLYAHLTDTINGQIHVLLYIVNDPEGPRFDIDKMPDGTPTHFGRMLRNIPAEVRAMDAGLAPGQVRRGLRILRYSIQSFEEFVTSLEHEIYFIEPLSYHNAIVFERYGFAYQQGRRLMERTQAGFLEGGAYHALMDGSTPFRKPEMETTIRGRSWAVHDGILGVPFSDVTMYKRVGEHAGVITFPDATW